MCEFSNNHTVTTALIVKAGVLIMTPYVNSKIRWVSYIVRINSAEYAPPEKTLNFSLQSWLQIDLLENSFCLFFLSTQPPITDSSNEITIADLILSPLEKNFIDFTILYHECR